MPISPPHPALVPNDDPSKPVEDPASAFSQLSSCPPNILTDPCPIEQHCGETLSEPKEPAEAKHCRRARHLGRRVDDPSIPSASSDRRDTSLFQARTPAPSPVLSIPELPRLSESSAVYVDHEICIQSGGLRLLPELNNSFDDVADDSDDIDEELAALHKRSMMPSIRLRPRERKRGNSHLYVDGDHFASSPPE